MIRELPRRHSFKMVSMSLPLCSGESEMAEALARMTARGERSSWDAAETNSCCFTKLFSAGRRASDQKEEQDPRGVDEEIEEPGQEELGVCPGLIGEEDKFFISGFLPC